MVTHQLKVERVTGKVCRPKTDVLATVPRQQPVSRMMRSNKLLCEETMECECVLRVVCLLGRLWRDTALAIHSTDSMSSSQRTCTNMSRALRYQTFWYVEVVQTCSVVIGFLAKNLNCANLICLTNDSTVGTCLLLSEAIDAALCQHLWKMLAPVVVYAHIRLPLWCLV